QSGPFIEWHGAQRWLWAPAAAASELHTLAQRAGGHATLFRRPQGALASAPAQAAVFPALDAVQQRIQTALQEQCDPHGVFNTRRLNPAWPS
ncbi:glycolate oxidase subunit GlcE, partial [bacterium]|nr:glycolate oxidase subunit GlcE [bacterium]